MELPKLQIPKSYLTAFAGYSCFLITRHLVKVLRQVNWYLVVSSLAFDFFCSCFISPNLVWCDVLWEKVFNGIAGMVLQQWPSCPSFPGVPHQLHSLQLHFIFYWFGHSLGFTPSSIWFLPVNFGNFSDFYPDTFLSFFSVWTSWHSFIAPVDVHGHQRCHFWRFLTAWRSTFSFVWWRWSW